MSNEVYAVSISGGANVYIQAKSKAAAKKHAVKDVEVRRLAGAEVAALIADGKAIAVVE